jgi:hypothetical protein
VTSHYHGFCRFKGLNGIEEVVDQGFFAGLSNRFWKIPAHSLSSAGG